MYIVLCYTLYLAASFIATVWTAQTLEANGQSFLIDAFHSNAELARSVNRLLVVGFYLLNIGYVTCQMRSGADVGTVRQAIELFTDKFGPVLIVLAIMHFFNLYIFNRLRKRGQAEFRPPILPDARIPLAPEPR